MPINIILKNSSTSGQIPATYTLELGELAVNTYDGKIFLKKEVDGIQTVVEVAGDALRSLSIANANGFAGSSNGGISPTITLSTTISGILKGDGTSLSAAIPGADYLTPTAGTASWAYNVVGAGGVSASYADTASYAILSQNASTANIATYAIDAGHAISSSRTISASYANIAAVALSAPSSISSSYALNALNALTASYIFQAVSASFATLALQATTATRANTAGTATSSLFANSATSATSASFAATAATATSASFAATAATAINTTSASYALNASNAITASFATRANLANLALTADNALTANSAVSANTANNATNATNATNAATASIAITASYSLNSKTAATASYVLQAVSTSFATLASQADLATRANTAGTATSSLFANNATNATHATRATNADNADTASYVQIAINANTASYVLRAVSASHAELASNADLATRALTANVATSSLFSNNATNATHATRATNADNADTASYVLNAKNANTASYILQAVSASFATLASSAIISDRAFTANIATSSLFSNNAANATNALRATNADNADTASYVQVAVNANTASYVLQATSASYASLASSAVLADRALTANIATSSLFSNNATNATNAIRATNADNADTASYVLNARNAISASYTLQADSASHALFSSQAVKADRATSASFGFYSNVANFAYSTDTATNATNATNADLATRALRADYTDNALSASQANVAIYARNASNADNAISSSYALTASYVEGGGGGGTPGGLSTQIQYNDDNNNFAGVPVLTYDGIILKGTGSFSGSFVGDLIGTSSWATNALTASSADSFLIRADTFEFTGSLNVSGSTTQIGNNNLLGNTALSGSIIISGALGTNNPTVKIYGDTQHGGYIRFDPVNTNIDTSISASYIYVSGSTNDLYFSQNGSGYNNVTRLRWLEGNLYTGLLHGGLITTQSSTVYQIGSGSGIIVSLNANLGDDPYPTIQFLNWGNLSASISAFTSSYQQCFVGIDSTNNIFAQGTPFNNGQFDALINIGIVLFQNGSTINGIKTQPSVAYGFQQSQNIFNRAFGPLKLSGYTLSPSGSSTGSLIVASGTAYAPGSNYTIDPNEPSYTVDSGTNISKIFRYRQSGSTWVYDTNGGAGYTTIDPTQYSNSGVLTAVPGTGTNREFSIQRVFYFPNSVVKAIVVYYGNATYASLTDATTNIAFEPFVEAPNTAANAVYLGAIIVRNNADFTVTDSYAIQTAGLFRSVGGSGGGGSVVTQTLAGLSDVLISGPTNGQALVYSSTAAKWENLSFISASISGHAATATSASYASGSTSASYAATASSADNFLVRGTLTAQTIVAQTITSSTDFVTGSTRFGSLMSNTHQFTGSVGITGSLTTVGSINATSITSSFTGSFTGSYTGSLTGSLLGTASWAQSASNAITAGFASNANLLDGLDSTVFATTGSNIFKANQTISGSLIVTGSASLTGSLGILGTVSASAFTGSHTGSFTGSLIGTASWANNAVTASFVTASNVWGPFGISSVSSASYASGSTSSSFAISSSWAVSASQAVTASSADSFIIRADTFEFTGSIKTSGSIELTGSFNVLGRVSASSFTGSYTGSFTGSLLGTSSWAVSASNSLTSSFITASNVWGPNGASSILTASYALSGGSSSTSSTASFVTASNVWGPFGANSILSASYASGSTSASYALSSSYAPNIYNSDGELTSNRIVGSGSGYSLTFNPNITLRANITGSSVKTVLTDFTGTTQNITASTVVQNNVDLSSTATEIIRLSYRNLLVNRSNSGYSTLLYGDELNIYAGSTNASGRISATGQRIVISRTDASDISSFTGNLMFGNNAILYHGGSSTLDSSPKYTSALRSYYSFPNVYQGTVNELEGFRNFGIIGAGSYGTSTINNYYGFRSNLQVGWTSGIYSGSITNHYGIYLDTPNVLTTGNIVNRWGIYAPDPLMRNFLGGPLLIGITDPGSFQLRVQGNTELSGSVLITGSLNVSDSITGSLFGTASWAVSASQALTSSFITASNVWGIFGSNSILSSSYASGSTSASYSLTASYIDGGLY
jgi:hypothetical protein